MSSATDVIESISSEEVLSATTAIDIFESLNVQIVLDEKSLRSGPAAGHQDDVQFEHPLFRWIIRHSTLPNSHRQVSLSVSPWKDDVEWELMVQMRICVAENFGPMKIVDRDVFQFSRSSSSMHVEIKPHSIHFLRFEMRTLNVQLQPLPAFNEGDLTVHFADGESPIRIYKDILSLLSDYMGNMAENVDELQVYPTGRSLDANFTGLTHATVAFNCRCLIYATSKFLYEFNLKPMSLMEKFELAVRSKLLPAVKQIVFSAVQFDLWDKWIASGWDAESQVGTGVYSDIICPTVAQARSTPSSAILLVNPLNPTDFLKPKNDSHHVKIFLRQTPFYVNRGLFQALGTKRFYFVGEDEYVAIFSGEMARACRECNVTPGKALLALLHFLYPSHTRVPFSYIKPTIIFCFDHNWQHAKRQLEQDLLLEMPKNENDYMEQLKFAEKFQLNNMIRALLQRAEGSLFEMAKELQQSGRFNELGRELRTALRDKLIAGWGLTERECNRLSARLPTLHLHRIGDALPEHGDAEMTLQSVDSDSVYGSVVEMACAEAY
ncbi:hypothetical protein WR25_25457 [Diploscapter pachys]|uniref:DUF7754 domain-containing protein n=1 Tax=Diploscapter pachys TaxID=2018661 RepID=A0A2A2JNN1_9BILA|nr:hypothetical protein WR25_25457 [Diploscapter pachys]